MFVIIVTFPMSSKQMRPFISSYSSSSTTTSQAISSDSAAVVSGEADASSSADSSFTLGGWDFASTSSFAALTVAERAIRKIQDERSPIINPEKESFKGESLDIGQLGSSIKASQEGEKVVVGIRRVSATTATSSITMASSRRDQLAVILDILSIAQKPVRQKRLLQEANLSYTQLKKYLSFLLETEFITAQQGKSPSQLLYVTSSKGKTLIDLMSTRDFQGHSSPIVKRKEFSA